MKSPYLYSKMEEPQPETPPKEIVEGLAKVQTGGNVFYNPVQEFNRDLSITVISSYAKALRKEINDKTKRTSDSEVNVEIFEPGKKYNNGLYILEALSATGLRSIRYAKEIPRIREIVANDLSVKAVEDISKNIAFNSVENIVSPSHSDATMLMYQHKQLNQFDVIDLDPYGCPSIFLDSAVQAIKNGGLLLVTATDMAVLAGNTPETCYSKYGAISLRIKCCHEMALRILLQCIESHANRYGRVYNGAHQCKFTTSKLSYVYHCTGCDSFELQPLGITRPNEKNSKLVKFCLPTGPSVSGKCEHCLSPYHIGGPIWSGPIHSPDFVEDLLNSASPKLGTYKRIIGVLSVISEELTDVPLYYTLERLSSTIKVETPSMLALRSAILNAGYKVSYTHMNKTSVKTNAPPKVMWDIMRSWEKLHPASRKKIEHNPVASAILDKKPDKEYSFELHPEAQPESKKMGLLRFQENPLPFWGPGSRAQAMAVGEDRMKKSKRNQGKRKREESDDSVK